MLMSSPAHGTVYMWRDSAGISHYTNKEYDIPARYKAKAKALYPEAADTAQGKPPNSSEPAKPALQLPAVTIQPVKSDEKPKETPPAVVAPPVVVAPPEVAPAPPARKSRRPPRVRSAEDD